MDDKIVVVAVVVVDVVVVVAVVIAVVVVDVDVVAVVIVVVVDVVDVDYLDGFTRSLASRNVHVMQLLPSIRLGLLGHLLLGLVGVVLLGALVDQTRVQLHEDLHHVQCQVVDSGIPVTL
jgi:hypothetical protein